MLWFQGLAGLQQTAAALLLKAALQSKTAPSMAASAAALNLRAAGLQPTAAALLLQAALQPNTAPSAEAAAAAHIASTGSASRARARARARSLRA